VDRRAAAFARLFEGVREGAYIGTLGPENTSTIAANPHLKLVFGYPTEVPEQEIRPLDGERFVDPQARVALTTFGEAVRLSELSRVASKAAH